MNVGIYKYLSSQEYHLHKESVSRSSLMDFKESAYRYWARHINPDRPKEEPTPAMIFGSAFHSFLLEPEIFERDFIIKPDIRLQREVGKEKYDRIQEERKQADESGKITITESNFKLMLDMRIALRAHNVAWNLIRDGIYEQSYFWNHSDTGLMLKARPDILHSNMIVDIKTCTDASPKAAERAMVIGGYHLQGSFCQSAVHALEGRWIDTVINIFIEREYPNSIGVYMIDPKALEKSHTEIDETLVALKDALRDNKWQDYEISTISLPAWY